MCLIDILPTNDEGVAKKLQEEEVRFKLKIDEEGRTNELLAKKTTGGSQQSKSKS